MRKPDCRSRFKQRRRRAREMRAEDQRGGGAVRRQRAHESARRLASVGVRRPCALLRASATYSSQSSNCAPQPAQHAQLREMHVRIDEPRQQKSAAQIGGRDVRDEPREPRRTRRTPRSFRRGSAVRRPRRTPDPCPFKKRIARRVKQRSPQDFAAFGSTHGRRSPLVVPAATPFAGADSRAARGGWRRRLARAWPEARSATWSTLAERRYRIANRLAHRNRQHQRRLAHGLAAEHHSRLGGALQKIDVKLRRHLGPRRQFVSGRPGRRHAALRVPQQVLRSSSSRRPG